MIYYVYGHDDLDTDIFWKYYVPKIQGVINSDRNRMFVCEGNYGFDRMFIKYIRTFQRTEELIIFTPYTNIKSELHIPEKIRNIRTLIYESSEKAIEDLINISNKDIVFIINPKDQKLINKIIKRYAIDSTI